MPKVIGNNKPIGISSEAKWLDIEGFQNRYQVSDQGEVKSLLTNRVLKPGATSRGYLSVSLYDGSIPKKPKSYTVHSLVASAFLGPKPDDKQINHKDANKTNNRASNLEYVTGKENIRHACDLGLIPVMRNNRKLSDDQVRYIRSQFSGSTPHGLQARLARELNVTSNVVKEVRLGISYIDIIEKARTDESGGL